MSKLRIAFFIDALKAGAGTENQVLDLLARLDPTRFETYLFTLRQPVPETVAARLPAKCDCFTLGRLRSFRAFGVFWRLIRTLQRERIDIAMIYFVDSQLLVPPAAFLAGRTRCVVNRRDMGYWYTPGLLRAMRVANKVVDYFVVNANAIKRVVADSEKFPPERIKVIYNMLAVKGAGPDATETPMVTRGMLGLPENVPIVVLTANLRPVKRVDRFIDMAALVAHRRDDVRFLILGGGELHEPLKAQATRLGLADKVVFAGSVTGVGPYLDLCKVGVLTSESEGLSNTLVEYSYNRLPIVAFNTGGNPEVVADKVTGYLVPEGDSEAMAARVLELLNDSELGQRMGQAGRERVEEQFSPQQLLVEWEEFFTLIAKAPRRSVRFE
jgi:L-malate glycosyltransferase